MPDLTDITEMQMKEMASNTEKSIKILFTNILKIMEEYGKDKIDKFVIDKAIYVSHNMNSDIDINKKNYALFSSNKITDENYAHNRESNNIGTNSLIAQYYDNCRKVDTFKMIPKEDTKKIFKKISKVTPIGIYDSIYRINQSEIINHHLEPQSRQISEVDLERSNTN